MHDAGVNLFENEQLPSDHDLPDTTFEIFSNHSHLIAEPTQVTFPWEFTAMNNTKKLGTKNGVLLSRYRAWWLATLKTCETCLWCRKGTSALQSLAWYTVYSDIRVDIWGPNHWVCFLVAVPSSSRVIWLTKDGGVLRQHMSYQAEACVTLREQSGEQYSWDI
jgi:hypothetical protein